VVVSVQGLVSIIAKNYLGGIHENEVRKNRSIRDILRYDDLLIQKKKMEQRGRYEIKLIQNVHHIIGRTLWDLTNTWAINPSAKYHFCNESLRSKFYKKQWDVKKCQKHSIFLSQAHYPIKGIQKVIQALPIILEHFPETKVYVAGNNFMEKPWYLKSGFAKYLEKLIKKNQLLKNQFIFLGPLNESEMLEQYKSAHVFVCPSSIENSPNSVGEAQLVGTPCVASYVGGNMEFIKDGETGFLYRFEETAMLAKFICTLFNDKDLANNISTKAHEVAMQRHDKNKNASRLNTIYNQIKNEIIFDL
jgi:glycosyltransferase involved in cell wall biosynthesis